MAWSLAIVRQEREGKHKIKRMVGNVKEQNIL